MSEVLEDADLLVTVSSTAAMEAWARQIPVGILTDVGVGETLGNHHFVASGALTSMRELADDVLPVADEAWLIRSGLDTKATASLGARIRSIVAAVSPEGGSSLTMGSATPLLLPPAWRAHNPPPAAPGNTRNLRSVLMWPCSEIGQPSRCGGSISKS